MIDSIPVHVRILHPSVTKQLIHGFHFKFWIKRNSSSKEISQVFKLSVYCLWVQELCLFSLVAYSKITFAKKYRCGLPREKNDYPNIHYQFCINYPIWSERLTGHLLKTNSHQCVISLKTSPQGQTCIQIGMQI